MNLIKLVAFVVEIHDIFVLSIIRLFMFVYPGRLLFETNP
jgi:hypothetical protein